jgi:hypothetical protein
MHENDLEWFLDQFMETFEPNVFPRSCNPTDFTLCVLNRLWQGRSFSTIASEIGMNEETFREHYWRFLHRLANFFRAHPSFGWPQTAAEMLTLIPATVRERWPQVYGVVDTTDLLWNPHPGHGTLYYSGKARKPGILKVRLNVGQPLSTHPLSLPRPVSCKSL